MKYLIDTIYLLGLAAITPKIVYRMLKHDRYKAGWSQRLGKVNRRFPDKKCIWIHAVSVGEVNATKTLVAGFKERFSDYEIIVSSTTDTGYARAHTLYANDHYVFHFPADLSWAVKRAFETLRPDVCLMMELEVWPNFTSTAKKMDIPVVVVNGRISDRSFPRYKLIRSITKRMFANVTAVLAQTNEYAERFVELGCDNEKVFVTNSLKYDTAEVTEHVQGADILQRQIGLDGQRFVVFGGTGPGEEQIALNVFRKLKALDGFGDVRTAIIPRKPERFDEVDGILAQSEFSHVRYSKIKNSTADTDGKPEIILGDTMGDLKKFYSLATVVFVGRSLVEMGGSDMMEPAALGKFTMFGPYTFNFKQTVDVLLKGDGAVEVKDADRLLNELKKSLSDTEYANTIAANGKRIIEENRGATRKTVEQIAQILG